MVDPVVVIAVGLLAVGVIGSVVPLVPGALASLAGVYLHWWQSGFAEPGLPLLAGFTLVGLVTLFVDWFGSAIGAGAGGASRRTTMVAAVVGVLLLLVTGPAGFLAGIAGTVFALEYYQHRDARQGARAAGYATVAALASTAVQLLLTGAMLVAFLVLVVF